MKQRPCSGSIIEHSSTVSESQYLTRWTKEIGERPAVKRGRMVNHASGPAEGNCASAMTPAISRPKPRTRSTRAGNPVSSLVNQAVCPTSHLMDGKRLSEAAVLAGMTPRGLSEALKRPNVLASVTGDARARLTGLIGKGVA